MLLCFPDGNVALHKVGARASLIIACPQSAPEKIGTSAPPPEQPGPRTRPPALAEPLRRLGRVVLPHPGSWRPPEPPRARPERRPAPNQPKPAQASVFSPPRRSRRKKVPAPRASGGLGAFFLAFTEREVGERTMTSALCPHRRFRPPLGAATSTVELFPAAEHPAKLRMACHVDATCNPKLKKRLPGKSLTGNSVYCAQRNKHLPRARTQCQRES